VFVLVFKESSVPTENILFIRVIWFVLCLQIIRVAKNRVLKPIKKMQKGLWQPFLQENGSSLVLNIHNIFCSLTNKVEFGNTES
jgi:hypothetical protein